MGGAQAVAMEAMAAKIESQAVAVETMAVLLIVATMAECGSSAQPSMATADEEGPAAPPGPPCWHPWLGRGSSPLAGAPSIR